MALVFMLGDLLAAPLEKHRHHNLVTWLTWNLLRMSVPIALIIVCLGLLIRRISSPSARMESLPRQVIVLA